MPATTHRAARHARQTIPILIVAVLAGLAIAAGRADGHAGQAAAVDLEDATIASLISDQRSNTRTARAIAEQYLARIDAIDRHGPSLRSVIDRSSDRAARRVRWPAIRA
jgi:hypothetical protein